LFTLTAANVAFGFWSHDIGGHTEAVGAELYTRLYLYVAFINCLEVAVPKRIKFVWAVLPCMHILTESVASYFIVFFSSLFCFRWVQWGAFSPIFRPHCGKTGDDVRRIWLYPEVSH